MTADAGIAFLTALGVKNIRLKENGWIEGSCPLAKWLHRKGVDLTPSFGLLVAPGDRSYFSCFSCRSGSAEELLHVLVLYTATQIHKPDFKTCHQLLDDEVQVVPLPEYHEFGVGGTTVEPWPQYWIDSFLPAWGHLASQSYLQDRGITLAQAQIYDLRHDPKRSMIVCPYRTVWGELAGARGRSYLPDVEGSKKHFDYSWQGRNNARLTWYHELALHLPGPVVVVEGQFDAWQTLKVWPKTVANLTAKPTLAKMTKLADSPVVIQIPDRDEAGQMSKAVYAKYCHQLGIPYKALWLDEGVKDPAECAPEYLKDLIEAVV